MTEEQKELQQLAQQSMAPPEQAAPPVDMEAFSLLAGMTNQETQSINQSQSEGSRESMIAPIQSVNGIGAGANPQNPLDNPAVMEEVMRQEIVKAQREAGNVSQMPPQQQQQAYPQQGFNNQPVYQPAPQMMQPAPQMQVQPQQYGEGMVFPPNLQNIILSKIVAIEKTYAKIVEQQKEILQQLKSNGS